MLAERKDITVSDLCQELERSIEYFKTLHSNADFATAAAVTEASKLELTSTEPSRKKTVPKRYNKGTTGYHPARHGSASGRSCW